MMMGTAQGLLQVQPINEENGYIKIRIKDVEIANNTDIILHIINPMEISQILDQLVFNIKHLDTTDRQLLDSEIKTIKSKLRTITTSSRQKRGLINIVGTAQKWLFGNMDDDDRLEIMQHLKSIDENNHNSIQNLNKQISINDHFNKTFLNLKTLLEDDRTKILQAINKSNVHIKNISDKISFLDQETKLGFLKNKVNQILDNIVSTKNNIIHPSMLTSEELDLYNINIHKLRLLKAGMMEYKNNLLVFAIKIPKDYLLTELQIIKPVPNTQNLEINEKAELVVEINNITYRYDETLNVKDLKLSTNCIINKKCSYIYNNITSIDRIDEETILLKNMHNETIIQNCNNKKYNLNGNFMINFNNCTLIIEKTTFHNSKFTIFDKFYYPSENIEIVNDDPISLKKIKIEYENNLKEIEEIKIHKNIIHGTNLGITLVLIIIVIVFTSILYEKNKNGKVKIINNMNPEASDLKRGGVTYTKSQDIEKNIEITDLPESYKIKTTTKPMSW